MPSYKGVPGASRFSKSTLDKVYKRGMGAYYSSGSRNVSAHAWAMGRVNSYMRGDKARTVDMAIYKRYRK